MIKKKKHLSVLSHSRLNSLVHTSYVPELSWRLHSAGEGQKINYSITDRDNHVPKSLFFFLWQNNFGYYQMIFESPSNHEVLFDVYFLSYKPPAINGFEGKVGPGAKNMGSF